MIRVLKATPTASGAYVAGDAVGGLIDFGYNQLKKDFKIDYITIVDKSAQSGSELGLTLFRRSFTPTADNAEFDPSDADLENALLFVEFPSTDYKMFKDNCMCVTSVDKGFVLSSGTALYGQLMTEGTPTWTPEDLDVYIVVKE